MMVSKLMTRTSVEAAIEAVVAEEAERVEATAATSTAIRTTNSEEAGEDPASLRIGHRQHQ